MKSDQSFTNAQDNPYKYIYVKNEKERKDIGSSIEESENLSSAEVTSEENFKEYDKDIEEERKLLIDYYHPNNLQIKESIFDHSKKEQNQNSIRLNNKEI